MLKIDQMCQKCVFEEKAQLQSMPLLETVLLAREGRPILIDDNKRKKYEHWISNEMVMNATKV